MASFAEGLAKGLMQSQEMQDRRADRERQSAITMATLANQAEELNYKRAERKKKQDALDEINKFETDHYTVTKQVPNPDFGKVPNAPQMIDQAVQLRPGEDQTPEGLKRDAQFLVGQMQIYRKYGLVTPDQQKAALEYSRAVNKDGLVDSVVNLMVTGQDNGASAALAKRFNLKQDTIQFVSKPVQGSKFPQMFILAKTNDGATIEKPLTPILSAMGIAAGAAYDEAISAPTKRDVAIRKDESIIGSNDASAAKNRADANTLPGYRQSQANVNNARAEALSDPDVKAPKLQSTMPDLEGKAVDMPGGEMLFAGVKQAAVSRGVSRKDANSIAITIINEAKQSVGRRIQRDWESDPKNKGKKIPSAEYNKREQALLAAGLPTLLQDPEIIARFDALAKPRAAARTSAMDPTLDQ